MTTHEQEIIIIDVCINKHLPGGELDSIRMLGVWDSLPAERAAHHLHKKLEIYGLNLPKEVATATIDEASFHEKNVTFPINSLHSLCQLHWPIYKKTEDKPQ